MNGVRCQTNVDLVSGDLHVGVLGCGSIGERHLRNLSGLGLRPVGIDTDKTRRDAVSALGFPVIASLDAANGLDALVICTPAPSHAAQALLAIRAGLDIFVEKPLATSVQDARAVHELAGRSARILAVGYNLRFDQGLQTLRTALREGRIGRLLYARFEFGQYLGDWRPGRDYRATVSARAAAGGGILFEASHELDILQWLCGPWRTVIAMVRRLGDLEIDVEDTASAIVETQRGVLAEVHVDFVRRGYTRGVTCVGTDGTLEWQLRSGTSLVGHDGSRAHLVGASEPNTMYVLELQAFIEAVRSRSPAAVTGADGIRALELIDAIRVASQTGSVVRA
jgi:predicted dehydrogenase